jgi:protein-disulfide isomerase
MGSRRALWTALAVLALAGLVDSLFLTWDHQIHLLDPSTQSGICSAGSGCEISRDPRLSELPLGGLPGLPISLLGVSFYLAFLLICQRRLRAPEEEAAQGLHLLAALAGVFVSVVLAVISLNVQGTLCPFCTILYGVNFLLLVIAKVTFDAPAIRVMERWPHYLVSVSGRWMIGAFLLSLAAGYAAYVPPLLEARQIHHETQMTEARALGGQAPVEADLAPVRARTPGQSKMLVIEIADLGCPHCHELYDTLHALQEADPSAFDLGLVHYPLDEKCNPYMDRPRGSTSCTSARASICAEGLDLGWPYLHYLFEHGRGASVDQLTARAVQMGQDGPAFRACMESFPTTKRLFEDIALATIAGVQGTPVFLVNGRKVEGGRPAEVIQAMLQSVSQADGAR